MPKIIDPTDLGRNVSVVFDITSPSARTIEISSSLNNIASPVPPLDSGSDSGVTLQALYSFCKEQWKSQNDLIKIPFPFVSITKNQFDLINNWNFKNDSTRYLIRDAGWSVQTGSANNVTLEEWVGIKTLGDVGTTDQVYLQQSSSNESPINFKMSGSINQAVKVYQSGSVNYKGYTKLFVREWNKSYDIASIQDDLAVETEEYIVYSLPLQNSTDLKISEAIEATVTGSPYTDVSVKYLSGSFFGAWANSTVYPAGTAVYGTDNRYYVTTAGGTSNGNSSNLSGGSDAGITWVSYAGERQIGSSYYPFNIIIEAGGGKNNTIAQIYTKIQYLLRQSTDIDSGTDLPAISGKVANPLLRFLGDTLITENGVYIDNFQDADTNSIDFYDVSGSVRRFPFVAAGTLNFNDNLKNDPSSSYFMFFNSVPSGSFGASSAVLVNNNTGQVISGSISNQSSIAFTFDYDNNVQGGRTASTDADVTVVGIGLTTAQYVITTATIERTKSNNISLVSTLERNYNNS